MRIIGISFVAVSFGLMWTCQPRLAQIAVTPTGPGATAQYRSFIESACGAGWCETQLDPAGALNLGNSATGALINDLEAQFPGWTVTNGGQLAGTFDVTHYLALNGV
jgi:hypothetical protein